MKKSHLLNLGITLGIISIVIFLITAILNAGLIFSSIIGIVSLAVMIGLPIIFVSNQRKSQNNSITFQEAFVTAFGGLVLAGIISTFFSIIYIKLIDPGYVEKMVIQQMETVAQFVKGASDEIVVKTLTETEEKIRKGFEPLGMLRNFGFQIALYAIFSLILAAVMKRKPIATISEDISHS